MPDSTPLTAELRETLTLVLAGGQGKRLEPLTIGRAKPAVPFGGTYRIIDFTLSNCIHSGLRRVFVLTQYQARSLEEHIRFGWNFLPLRLQQFISVRPPHFGGMAQWYRGTADAIYQNIDTIEAELPRYVLILSGDHIYRMDYGRMLQEHIDHDAALTIGAVKIPQEESSRFGIFQVDNEGQVGGFQEKPAQGAEIPGEPGSCLASMGIYIFSRDELIRRLRDDAALGEESSHDFGKDIIPRMVGEVPVYTHMLVDPREDRPAYWRDVGTIESYFEANLELCSVEPQFNLYDYDWPIYTLWHNDPPAKTVFDDPGGRKAEVLDSLLAPGVIVSGGTVKRSILSNRVFVDEGAQVEDCILFSGVNVGKGARLRRCIIDKWVDIPPGTEIGYDPKKDAEQYTVSTTGITVVPRVDRYRD